MGSNHGQLPQPHAVANMPSPARAIVLAGGRLHAGTDRGMVRNSNDKTQDNRLASFRDWLCANGYPNLCCVQSVKRQVGIWLIGSYIDHLGDTPYNAKGDMRKSATLNHHKNAAASFLSNVLFDPFSIYTIVGGKEMEDRYISSRIETYKKWDTKRAKREPYTIEMFQTFRQQVQDQMQSIHLGGPIPPQNMPYGGGGGMQQLPQQQQPFYNNGGYPQQQQHQQFPPQQQPQYNMYPNQQQYPPPPPQTYPPQQYQSNAPQQQDMNSTVNHIPGAASYHDPNNMQQPNQSNSRYYQPSMIGSPTAGMYNGVTSRNNNHMQPQPNMQPMQNPQAIMQPTRPMAVAPGFYTRILVTEPLLLQSSPGGLFGIGQPPHWSYQITTELNPNVQQQSGQGGHQGVWMVRRRFRHVVALEDRLRDDCPGAILPPR